MQLIKQVFSQIVPPEQRKQVEQEYQQTGAFPKDLMEAVAKKIMQMVQAQQIPLQIAQVAIQIMQEHKNQQKPILK